MEGAAGLFVALVLVVFSGTVQQRISDFSYVKYRAAIHSKNLDQIIQTERFASGRMGQIMRAAQNQWFINTYLRDEPFGTETSAAYFNLKPHFNKGASFTTQTTDLVVTRYVIAEHGAAVVILLLLILLVTTGYYSLFADLSKARIFAPFGMLLLLFTISFFIWLTATNRFIFFGQDFPLLSLTSLFTLVFSAGLLLVVVLYRPETRRIRDTSRPRWSSSRFSRSSSSALSSSKRTMSSTKTISPSTSVSTRRANDFQRLNESFSLFQEGLSGDPEPDSLVNAFFSQMEDTIISQNQYSQSIFEHFVRQQADKTDPENLLHLVQRRGKYRFALNRNFYMIQPPQSEQKAWAGNLYAAREEAGGAYLIDMQDRGRHILIAANRVRSHLDNEMPDSRDKVRVAVIPASWVYDGKPAVIAWSDNTTPGQADFSISNSQSGAESYTQEFSNPAIRLRHDDLLTLHDRKGKKRRYRYLDSYNQYLAKNIWLNGKRRIFYPLGDKLLWAYYYAEAVKSAYSGTDSLDKNVRVSIDYALTEQLHHITETHFRKNHWEQRRLGLVVANGDGQLRALFDYKPEGTIDPNDIKEFHDKNREFYLRNNNKSERETFGNVNLLRMNNGPGSSLKPIVYTATASQYDLGWRGMTLVETPGSVVSKLRERKGNRKNPKDLKGFISHYGGKEVNMYWTGIDSGDFWRRTPSSYLTNSKNLYHSNGRFPRFLQPRLARESPV